MLCPQLLRSISNCVLAQRWPIWSGLHWKRFCLRATLGPLVCVWSRSTDTIPSVWVNTMSVANTMRSCLYYDSMSIPWSPCLYHESMSKPRVHTNTISPCIYYESMSLQWVLVNSMHQCPYHESFPIMSQYLYHESRKSNRNKEITEIQLSEIQ